MAQIPLPDAARMRLSIYKDELMEFRQSARANSEAADRVSERMSGFFSTLCKEMSLPQDASLDLETWSIRYTDTEGEREASDEEAIAAEKEAAAREDSNEV